MANYLTRLVGAKRAEPMLRHPDQLSILRTDPSLLPRRPWFASRMATSRNSSEAAELVDGDFELAPAPHTVPTR